MGCRLLLWNTEAAAAAAAVGLSRSTLVFERLQAVQVRVPPRSVWTEKFTNGMFFPAFKLWQDVSLLLPELRNKLHLSAPLRHITKRQLKRSIGHMLCAWSGQTVPAKNLQSGGNAGMGAFARNHHTMQLLWYFGWPWPVPTVEIQGGFPISQEEPVLPLQNGAFTFAPLEASQKPCLYLQQ